jgi:hypothetical protein
VNTEVHVFALILYTFADAQYYIIFIAIGWKQAHGFFTIMGGFILLDDENELYTLKRQRDTEDPTKASIELYLQLGKIHITEKEIKDKSKGDMLSKGIVIVQTGWFVLQCISRLVEHLPLTELELVTVGFAVLNLATYVFWWEKPLNVKCAVRVLIEKQISEQGIGGREGHSGSPGGSGRRSEELNGAAAAGVLVSSTGYNTMPNSRNAVADVVDSVRHNGVLFAIRNGGWTALNHLFWTPFGPFIDWLFGRDVTERGATRVSTLFAGSLNTDNQALAAGLVATLVASVFGAIHCIAWSFTFPLHTEQIIWRISALCITCLPWPVFLCTAIIALDQSRSDWLAFFLRGNGYIYIFIYITARISLLVQAFISLRTLPPRAYETVRWTTFIPHV